MATFFGEKKVMGKISERDEAAPLDYAARVEIVELLIETNGMRPQRRLRSAVKPKTVGKNVLQYIKREDELRERREAVAYNKSQEIYSAVRNQATRARQRLNQGRFEEIKQLEVEVKARRHARLKVYYRQQEALYDQRLRQMGLAYLKAI